MVSKRTDVVFQISDLDPESKVGGLLSCKLRASTLLSSKLNQENWQGDSGGRTTTVRVRKSGTQLGVHDMSEGSIFFA